MRFVDNFSDTVPDLPAVRTINMRFQLPRFALLAKFAGTFPWQTWGLGLLLCCCGLSGLTGDERSALGNEPAQLPAVAEAESWQHAYGPVLPAAGLAPLGNHDRQVRKNLKHADRYGYVPKYYGSAPTGYVWPIYGSRAPHASLYYVSPRPYSAPYESCPVPVSGTAH